jgi:hypothetical protein
MPKRDCVWGLSDVVTALASYVLGVDATTPRRKPAARWRDQR